ncbi:hypothetical protein P376_6073 [Streptomyces sp. HCCB10043]|nr:hypothetical protein P376_6073 [Streptomyces sp. HCCB10043]
MPSFRGDMVVPERPTQPETMRSGVRTTRARNCWPRRSERPRSARAARTEISVELRVTATTRVRAPSASAASSAPSRIRCGARLSRTVSLRQAGSPSLPLITTTGRTPRRMDAFATARSFLPNGKPAPPLPRREIVSASSASRSPVIGSSGPCTLRCMARSSRSTRSNPVVSCGSPTTRTSGTSGRGTFTVGLLRVRARVHRPGAR